MDGSVETPVRYTEYSYDSRGQMTGFAELSQKTAPTAKEITTSQITYSYDNDGNIKKVIYPTTKDGICALSYVYDQNGWLTQIKGDVRSGSSKTEKTVRSYTYDAYGKVKEIKDYRNLLKSTAQAVKKVYTYDSFDRVKEMKYTDLVTGKEMESYSYSYDKNSNIIQKTEINNYPSEDAKKVNETKTYTYDGLGQLTKTVTTDHKKNDQKKTVTYTYDKAGNRTKEDDGTTQTAYTYNGLDQLKTATKAKGTAVDEVRQYSYDANGNQTEIKNTKTGQTESYAYDAENRLSQVSVTSKDGKTSVTQQNRYNGDGQRIQKVEGSKTTNYYYQDGVVSYTTDATGIQTSQNLIGTDGNIIATQRYGSDNAGYYLYNKDIQGSSTSLVKEDGSADSTYQYTDFGETTINGDDKAGNEVCYTGGIYDQSTGLYYLNARYYNPEDGRFVTEDTYRGEIIQPETANLYMYCANNPVNYVDPSGHWVVTLGMDKSFNAIASGGVSVQLGVDSSGRFNLSKTKYGGFKISSSFGKSKALVISVMPNMSNVSSLSGWSVKAGIHADFLCFSVSGDAYVNIPNKLKDNGTAGISVSGGVQASVKKPSGGAHVYLTYTRTSSSFSIKNIMKKKKYSKKFSFNGEKIHVYKSKTKKKVNRIGVKVNKKYTAYIYQKNKISMK